MADKTAAKADHKNDGRGGVTPPAAGGGDRKQGDQQQNTSPTAGGGGVFRASAGGVGADDHAGKRNEGGDLTRGTTVGEVQGGRGPEPREAREGGGGGGGGETRGVGAVWNAYQRGKWVNGQWIPKVRSRRFGHKLLVGVSMVSRYPVHAARHDAFKTEPTQELDTLFHKSFQIRLCIPRRETCSTRTVLIGAGR